MRKVTRTLPRDIQDTFKSKGILYRRCFGGEFGSSIEYAFGTNSRDEINEYCRLNSIQAKWFENGTLVTSFMRHSHALHPITGECIWFNHMNFYSRASLEPKLQRLLKRVPDEKLAFSSRFGTDEEIPKEIQQIIKEHHTNATFTFDWRKGDILVLDNMLYAHGRRPYEGAREIFVMMAEDTERFNPMEISTRRIR